VHVDARARLAARPFRPPRVSAAKVKFQHVGRDEAGRAPVRSFRGGYRRRLGRAPKPEGAEECVCTRAPRCGHRATLRCGGCQPRALRTRAF
jgi:hypothetical protein